MDNLPDLPEKGRYRLKFRGTHCLNCDYTLDLDDKYCPNCSQANSTKKLSLKDFLDEFFASFISYDSKLLKTLGALLLRPGKITRDYINGKRISYTNPFRFLLSLTIIYFLMLNFSGNLSGLDKHGKDKNIDLLTSFNGFDVPNDATNTDEFMQTIDSLKNKLKYDEFIADRQSRDSVILSDPSTYFKKFKAEENTFNDKQEFFAVLLRKDSIYDFKDALTKYKVPKTFENVMAFNVANSVLGIQSRPGSFVSAMIAKLPFAVFFFLPVFAIFVWVAYIRKNYSYTDHLIFSFHNTALLFILLIISYLIDSIFSTSSNWVFLIIFALYHFQAMRKFYSQGFLKTIVKYLSLNVIFFFLAFAAILILLAGNIFI